MAKDASGTAVSRAWSWRHAITKSDLGPTTRHLLLTLSIFMDSAGRSCFPSIEDLVAHTGLVKRTVITHLAIARDAGWLESRLHGFRGQKWKQLEYRPRWPGRDVDWPAEGDDRGAEGGEGGAARTPASAAEVVHVTTEAGAPRAPKVVQHVHQDKEHSTDQSNTSPEREKARARETTKLAKAEAGFTVDQAIKLALELWPDAALQSEVRLRSAVEPMAPAKRKTAVDRIPVFLAFHQEKQGRAKLPFLHNYLGEEHRWAKLPDPVKATRATGGIPGATIVEPFGRSWWWLFFEYVEQNAIALLDHRSAPALFLRQRVSAAMGRIGWPLDQSRRPEIEASAQQFRQIPVERDEYETWRQSLTKRGVILPRPEAPFIFVPTEFPREHFYKSALKNA